MPGSKPKTILFVVPSAYLLGGVQIWLEYLLRGLNQSGFKCVCGAVDGRYHNADAYFEKYSFTHQAKIGNPSGTQFGRIKSLTNTIIESDADAVVGVNIADVYLATHKARKIQHKPISLIATLHGFGPDYFADLDSFEAIIDAVLVTNKLTAQALLEMTSMPEKKIYYSPYGVEFGSQLVRHNEPAAAMRILYSGRIENQQKRCGDLIDIAGKLYARGLPFELIVAGDGDYREELERALLEHVPAEQIVFTGTLEHADLMGRVLPGCDVLIITSQWETGPIVAWEAMSLGVTVVSSRYIGSEQEGALQNGVNCLLFDIGDTDQAVEHILSLQQSNLIDALRAEGRELIRSRYTQEKSVASFASNIETILESEQVPGYFDERQYNYRKAGRIERIFGHTFGNFLRRICNKPALVNSAGDEWPHALTPVQDGQQRFLDELLNQFTREK
ncbi:MAG: glycosyltransferase family 4 protein [Arenicella sp.]|nr:glycosyltransferase family 4 protein [Arenicella sp.]